MKERWKEPKAKTLVFRERWQRQNTHNSFLDNMIYLYKIRSPRRIRQEYLLKRAKVMTQQPVAVSSSEQIVNTAYCMTRKWYVACEFTSSDFKSSFQVWDT